ncbi:uncharacterized protein LOC117343756 isoform X2 [Pecten maximus]|uniref:uncharacterized protein LOC117343756 isoform X2 n=1 Tax=Pecten maximus TaxID=6579 RepID=UPI001457F75A|nr:uncharacterized protein LOC117343756 isoform X2 [Pecten maximus]
MFQCTFFTMTLLILLVLLPLVETSNFPKSCHVKNGVIDCSGVSMRDVQVEKDRIFHQIRRLYFKDVLHFYLTCSQFPNVDFLRIEHTPLPCDHFRLCGGVNIVLNRIVCDRDATTTMFPTSGETSPTTTLRTTMSPASGETSPTTTLRTTMSPASGETSPTTTLRTTMFPTSGETSPTTTLRTTSSNTPASIFVMLLMVMLGGIMFCMPIVDAMARDVREHFHRFSYYRDPRRRSTRIRRPPSRYGFE